MVPPLLAHRVHMAGQVLLVAVTGRNAYEMGKRSSKRRWFPPMRFSRPRAPSAWWRRIREDIDLNPERYARWLDRGLYAGVIFVLALAAYLLLFARS